MPRKTATSKPVQDSVESETPVVSESKPKKTKATSESKTTDKKPVTKRASKKEAKNIVEEEVKNTEEGEDVSDVESTGTISTRQVPTKESVIKFIDDIIEKVDAEISRLRENQNKSKGVKFLRSLNKLNKTLKSQTARVMKQRQRTNRKNNNNSGFLKPVRISNDMAKFTGWDASELKSRVDVTKFVCNYIKENQLQNPTDRRQIVADSKLSKLLNYDSKKETEPLTYYRIQSYMKKHFLPAE